MDCSGFEKDKTWWQAYAERVQQVFNNTNAFISELWNARPQPYEGGYFDPCYGGLLYLFSLMHLSKYQIIRPFKITSHKRKTVYEKDVKFYYSIVLALPNDVCTGCC
jgi:hypothetical protein